MFCTPWLAPVRKAAGTEIMVFDIIREQDLPLLHYKIERLERRRMLDFDSSVASWEEEAALMVEVRSLNIRHHVAPVVQLGFGRCSLAMKSGSLRQALEFSQRWHGPFLLGSQILGQRLALRMPSHCQFRRLLILCL